MSRFFRIFCCFQISYLFSFAVGAHTHHSFYAGVGYEFQNSLGKITHTDNAQKNILGTETYPLILRYDHKILKDLFFSPRAMYTLFPRVGSNSNVKVTQWHLVIPVGMNCLSSTMDWSAGLGLQSTSYEGSGGAAQLNNGGGTSTFALPGRRVDSKVITLNFGTSYKIKSHFFGFDLMTSGSLSDKRTFNLMLSYLYQFSGERRRR